MVMVRVTWYVAIEGNTSVPKVLEVFYSFSSRKGMANTDFVRDSRRDVSAEVRQSSCSVRTPSLFFFCQKKALSPTLTLRRGGVRFRVGLGLG